MDKVQLKDIVLHTADDFEIIIDFPWPTYPTMQCTACRKNALIELTLLIGVKVKIHLDFFDDAAAFINWLDRLCDTVHQECEEIIFHTKEVEIPEAELQPWLEFVKAHPMLEHDLHGMVSELFDEDQRAHKLLCDIVLFICKLRISGFQKIRVSQIHRAVDNMNKCSLGWMTSTVTGPLSSAALLHAPALQPYLYGNKRFQVCRVYGSLATRLLGGLPLTLCKANVFYYFDPEGRPLN